MKKAGSKFDLEATVTAKIIAALEAGTRPWQKSWTGTDADGLPLNASGRAYRGINIFMLWMEQMIHGYSSRHWFTMKQANNFGAKIRKGQKSTMVIYAKPMEKEVEDKDNPGKTKKIKWFFNKYYLVWNADQIDGLPEKFSKPEVADSGDKARLARIEHAEEFFAKTGSTVRSGGNRAFYSVTDDFIGMPEFNAFKDAESYYATLGHEHVHWTRHPSRLNREKKNYAEEELVAEIGAAILCAGLGIGSDVRDDHASYVASWLKALKDDKRLIFVAAAQAQRAVDYLAKFSEPVETELGEETQTMDEGTVQEAA
jgi:antirestriction protein ArdC